LGCGEPENLSPATLRILEPEINVGKFKSTDSIVNYVTIKNDSEVAYKLTELALSCGCLSSDFRVTTLQPGEQYDFEVSIFNALLGEGTQHGEIATEPPMEETLRFDVHYEAEPSTYLFPDNYLFGQFSDEDGNWTGIAEFSVEALDKTVDLIEPIRLDSVGFTFPSGLEYQVIQPTTFTVNEVIKIRVRKGEFVGGPFCDYFTMTVVGEDTVMKFPVAVSGSMMTDALADTLRFDTD
jgi:hypothetical protein